MGDVFCGMSDAFRHKEIEMAFSDGEFAGRCAIVTGSGRGIGKAIALDFARAGAFVHLVSQSANALQVSQEIADAGGRAIAHVGSVSDFGFCRSVVDAASAQGGADTLVNGAAILGETGKFLDMPIENFAEVYNVNLVGAAAMMQLVLPGMIARGFGRIVNFAGGGAAYSYLWFTPYSASKVALVRLTEIIVDEIDTKSVTINVIAPGAVATDMNAQVMKGGGEVRTLTKIEEPVKLTHYLCSAEAGHITGRFLHVRDRYEEPDLFEKPDMFKLRRLEIR